MDLHNTYGAVALSAKANVGDGALARQVSGVLGVFPTEVRGSFMGTNRSKLLVDECVSLENRCKELAKRHTGATFLRQVDTRFTAYTQVIGPLIIKQVNAANYLTSFLSSIVSLLPHEMQFRAMKYWNESTRIIPMGQLTSRPFFENSWCPPLGVARHIEAAGIAWDSQCPAPSPPRRPQRAGR